MTELAAERPDGLACLAFPFSVESLEIVASLFLVTQRRAGRRVGALLWVAPVAEPVAGRWVSARRPASPRTSRSAGTT
jgi:hypothetical protein